MIIPGLDYPITEPSDHIPGVRCPKCLAQGNEMWVLPGKYCPKRGHPCE